MKLYASATKLEVKYIKSKMINCDILTVLAFSQYNYHKAMRVEFPIFILIYKNNLTQAVSGNELFKLPSGYKMIAVPMKELQKTWNVNPMYFKF